MQKTLGVIPLYMLATLLTGLSTFCMHIYISKYGIAAVETASAADQKGSSKGAGVMEGLQLMWHHNYVKGIFAVSCLYLIQVAMLDYMMKLLAQARYQEMYAGDAQRALRGFASFMGHFGQVRLLLPISHCIE